MGKLKKFLGWIFWVDAENAWLNDKKLDMGWV